MNGQAEVARAQAGLITGGRLHRIDYTAPRKRFSIDNAKSAEDLIAIGRGEALKKENLDEVKRLFLNGKKVEPFVPIRVIGSPEPKATGDSADPQA